MGVLKHNKTYADLLDSQGYNNVTGMLAILEKYYNFTSHQLMFP